MRTSRYPRTNPSAPLTSFQQQASAAAYTERDSLLWAYNDFDQACKKAIELNREGRPGKAHFTLVASSLRVAKAIRDLEAVDELSALRLYEFNAAAALETHHENQENAS